MTTDRTPVPWVHTHGGWYGYCNRCRCLPCRIGGTAYMRRRYAAKKEAAA